MVTRRPPLSTRWRPYSSTILSRTYMTKWGALMLVKGWAVFKGFCFASLAFSRVMNSSLTMRSRTCDWRALALSGLEKGE